MPPSDLGPRISTLATSRLLLLLSILATPARAQQEKPAPSPKGKPSAEAQAPSTPTRTQKVADLSGRYRFSERYTVEDPRASTGLVGPYRVAILEVLRDSFDSPQGAPRKVESTRQAIYAERPVELGALGVAASTTRTIEKYQSSALDDPSKTTGARPLEGLTLFFRPKGGDPPQVLSLIVGRTITEQEFDTLAHQVYVPAFAALLPVQVVRLGDTWRIPRKAAQALLGDPAATGEGIIGKLSEIRKEVDGPRMVASIGISGKSVGSSGETTVNAELLFTFRPAAPAKDTPAKPSSPADPAPPIEDVTEARGAITELRLGQSTTGPQPGSARLKVLSNRELTVHRQLGIIAGSPPAPPLPKIPEPNEANSWIEHIDPAGRYSFRHPQEFLDADAGQGKADPNTLVLSRTRREGRDLLQVEFFPRTLAPEDLKKEMDEKYAMLKLDVLKGDENWLPEAEWPKMKVYRINAALKVKDSKTGATAGSTRIHFDGYLIQSSKSSSLLAIASTSKEAVTPFRREVEQVLRSIRLDPPRKFKD